MIAKVAGIIDSLKESSIILETKGGIFYEVFLPSGVVFRLKEESKQGEPLTLHTLYHIEGSASFGNQVPRLFGFTREIDKEFYETFLTVQGLGARKALKSLTKPVNQIAAAIEGSDVAFLKSLPGISKRLAEKVIAELKGKVARFALAREGEPLSVPADTPIGLTEEGLDILTRQLGYARVEADEMIADVFRMNDNIKTPEELIRAIYLLRK